jgi:hypothetical protein
MMRALALLCGLLVAVITAEVWSGWNGDDGTGRAAAAPVVVTPPTAAPGAQRRGSRQQWVTTVLGRPLFAPDRRPAAEAGGSDPVLPRLTGIIASPDHAVAIFQPADGKPVAVRHGATIGGWAVLNIVSAGVSLEKAGRRIVLSPRLDGVRSGGIAAAEAQPAPSRWLVAPATGILRARWSNPQLQP